MKITFLGTGTSQGVPVIACHCPVCSSTDARDKRLRSSVLLEAEGKVIVIDCGPDFRYQMLRAGVQQLDALVITHEHKDHIAGLDDVRAFNFKQQREVDVFATPSVQKAIKREFSYIFSIQQYPGIPRINMIDLDLEPFLTAGIPFTPIEVLHHKLPVLGFRIGDFSYVTDAKTISDTEINKLRGSRILVLNALQREAHLSHFTLDEAIAMAETVGAEKTYFTHISHRLGKHEKISAILPKGIELAYDGLQLYP